MHAVGGKAATKLSLRPHGQLSQRVEQSIYKADEYPDAYTKAPPHFETVNQATNDRHRENTCDRRVRTQKLWSEWAQKQR